MQKRTIASLVMSAVLLLGSGGAVLAQPPEHARAQSGRPSQEQLQERKAAIRQQREERVAEIKQRVEERKAEIQQQVCERRESNLQRVIPRLSTSAVTLVDRIDVMYDRVVGFYESGQLTVSNYDELKENVDTAQADAHAAVEALDEFEFEIDCENPNVGEQLDSFRTAVQDAREPIKEYRDALVELISSLRAEAAEENAENNDGTESENETENESTETESESENEGTETETENETENEDTQEDSVEQEVENET